MRALFFLMLLANLLFFGWTQGLFKAWGWAPADPTEPHRLAQQVRPEALRTIKPSEVPAAEPAAATACLQTPLTDEAQVQAVKAGLAERLRPAQWQIEPYVMPARWIVYMGRFDNADQVARKRQELTARTIPTEPLRSDALAPGLSLGGHPSQAQAQAALARLAQRGVRTARVVQELPEVRGQMLRLPTLDEAQRVQLAPQWAAWGVKPPVLCGPDATPPAAR